MSRTVTVEIPGLPHGGQVRESARTWVRLPLKIAIVSTMAPPYPAGLAHITQRLFQDVSPDDYCLIEFPDYGVLQGSNDREGWQPGLAAHTYRVHPVELWAKQQERKRSPYALGWVRHGRFLAAEIVRRAALIARIVRRERCEAIVAYSGPLPGWPASYLASRITGVPLFLHLFDHWRSMQTIPSHERLSAWLEPHLPRRAAGVIVCNEFLRDEYLRLSGVDSTVAHNPCADEVLARADEPNPWPTNPGEIRIVFTGSIQPGQFESFRNLLVAIEEDDLANVTLHVYSLQSPETFAAEGVRGRMVHHGYQPARAIYDVQRQADILFMPLAFDSWSPELNRTAASTKFPDYLATGRPILVHAVAGAYPCWYAQEYDCAAVVDAPDPRLLAAAIRRIRDDVAYRESLVTNAVARARTDHAVPVVRQKIIDVVASAASRATGRESRRDRRQIEGDSRACRSP